MLASVYYNPNNVPFHRNSTCIWPYGTEKPRGPKRLVTCECGMVWRTTSYALICCGGCHAIMRADPHDLCETTGTIIGHRITPVWEGGIE